MNKAKQGSAERTRTVPSLRSTSVMDVSEMFYLGGFLSPRWRSWERRSAPFTSSCGQSQKNNKLPGFFIIKGRLHGGCKVSTLNKTHRRRLHNLTAAQGGGWGPPAGRLAVGSDAVPCVSVPRLDTWRVIMVSGTARRQSGPPSPTGTWLSVSPGRPR